MRSNKEGYKDAILYLLVYIVFIIGLFAFLLVGRSYAFEYENLTYNYEVHDYDLTTSAYITFNVTSTTTFDRLSLYLKGDCTTNANYPSISLGDVDTGPIKNSETTDINGNVTSFHSFDWSDYQTLGPDWYYFLLQIGACTEKPIIYGININPYSTTTEIGFSLNASSPITETDLPYINVTGYDIYDSVSVYELPDWQGEVYIESEYELQVDDENYCLIGSTCFLNFNYNSAVVGYNVYLIDSELETQIGSSKELINVPLKQDYFNIGSYWSPASSETKEFCLVIPDKYYIRCVNVTYLEESIITFCDDWDCDCNEISTSTFDIASDIQCGFTKLACWGICPSDQSFIDFTHAVNRLENIFPYSIYNQVKNIWYDIQFSTSTSVLSVNFTDLIGVEGFDKELTLASSTMISSTLGPLWDDYIYKYMEWFIYIMFIVYLTARIIGLARQTGGGEILQDEVDSNEIRNIVIRNRQGKRISDRTFQTGTIQKRKGKKIKF